MVLINGDDRELPRCRREVPRRSSWRSAFRQMPRRHIRDVGLPSAPARNSRCSTRGSRCSSWASSTCATPRWRSARRISTAAAGGDRESRGLLRRRVAPAGSARHGARDHGDRRLRASPHRDPRDPARPAPHSIRGRRLWAVFEPRSNTTRRAVFQHELPDGARRGGRRRARASGAPRSTPGRQPARPRARRRAISTPSANRPFTSRTWTHIIARLRPLVQEPDVLVIFSATAASANIHARLLAEL